MLVDEYMTPDPLVVATDESIDRVAELIRAHGIHQVPVVDHRNHLVGIITDRDLRTVGCDGGKEATELIAEDIMSTDLVTIPPGADLLDAAQLLYERQFAALPVVMGEHIVGLIKSRDLLRRLIETSEENSSKSALRYEHA